MQCLNGNYIKYKLNNVNEIFTIFYLPCINERVSFCHRSAKQALDWIHDTGDFYLSTHSHVGHNRDETEALLREHNEFKVTAKVYYFLNTN